MERTVNGNFIQVAGVIDHKVNVLLQLQNVHEFIRMHPHEAEELAKHLIVAADSANRCKPEAAYREEGTPVNEEGTPVNKSTI